jgi:RimJ/RimL family protein N-acetyltransferase
MGNPSALSRRILASVPSMPFTPIATVASRRLTLRPVTEPDLPDLLEINGDPEVTRFLPYDRWQSMDDGTAWLRRMEALAVAGTGQQLVIVRNADSKVIGTLLLFKFEEPSARLELGYVLGRQYWQQGLMREALESICAHAFSAMSVRRIEAEVNPANTASDRLLRRVGFTMEGTLRKRWVGKGVTYDSNFYGYLVEDWQAMNPPLVHAS